MDPGHSTPLRWLVVRQADDQHWWLAETSDDIHWSERGRSLLDPQQVAALMEVLGPYYRHGLTRRQVAAAFRAYRLEAEVADGQLRLAATGENILDAGGEVFALPVIDDDETGAYYDFLDALSTARIRLLNATHHYVRNCTESEMFEELEALDQDRFFGDEAIHVGDEIAEILQWGPAEWDGL
jgi:hypothetical protein